MTLPIQQKIASGQPVIAVNIGGHNPDLVEILARVGADIALIDCERTGVGLDSATELIRAARASGIPAVVRSWSKVPEVIVQYLDRKADGIIVPRVDSAEEAASIVQLVRYACGKDAASKLVIPQIESRAAVAAVDALAAVEGVDVFLIGPNDLTHDMTGSRGSGTPEVHAAIDHVCARLAAAGRKFGMPCPLDEVPRFQRRGATFAYYHLEWLLQRSLAELGRELRGTGER